MEKRGNRGKEKKRRTMTTRQKLSNSSVYYRFDYPRRTITTIHTGSRLKPRHSVPTDRLKYFATADQKSQRRRIRSTEPVFGRLIKFFVEMALVLFSRLQSFLNLSQSSSQTFTLLRTSLISCYVTFCQKLVIMLRFVG